MEEEEDFKTKLARLKSGWAAVRGEKKQWRAPTPFVLKRKPKKGRKGGKKNDSTTTGE